MDLIENWEGVRKLFRRAFNSSFHCSIACVDRDRNPHITPIGSLILTSPGKGFYFEEFTRQLPDFLEHHPRVCVLAVDSGLWFWLKSLVRGRFERPPAIRLSGSVGPSRPATAEEIARWHRRVRWLRFSKGYRVMWRHMKRVRDIQFDRIQPVHIGTMTRNDK